MLSATEVLAALDDDLMTVMAGIGAGASPAILGLLGLELQERLVELGAIDCSHNPPRLTHLGSKVADAARRKAE